MRRAAHVRLPGRTAAYRFGGGAAGGHRGRGARLSDAQRARIRRDDTIIMFSDGALDALGERTQETIGRVLADAPDCQAAAERLLHAAQAAGAEDDMTVMVIRIA